MASARTQYCRQDWNASPVSERDFIGYCISDITTFSVLETVICKLCCISSFSLDKLRPAIVFGSGYKSGTESEPPNSCCCCSWLIVETKKDHSFLNLGCFFSLYFPQKRAVNHYMMLVKYCHLPTEMFMKVPILYFMRTQIPV